MTNLTVVNGLEFLRRTGTGVAVSAAANSDWRPPFASLWRKRIRARPPRDAATIKALSSMENRLKA